ncbi:hypothetical protein GOP47_0021855 [Adiantum capillus-veneris]|uniref:Pesticidal crystal protein domain-containing protein n=1 Tax=Adiantum capillus-veneris TaxID=13818 RepID=A0A9D4Z5M2_ADICA|nr:hypothetical protein GOP47_0021855 [Adiantum capillus-veneris]
MSVVTSQLVEDAVLKGFQDGISLGLGLVPAAGPFLQLFFGHVWDLALADRTAAQKKAAMDSLFESVGKLISQALAESVADQARAYNASIAQLGQDYRLSVESYKENASSVAVQKVVVRFENCKSTLVHMLNLYAQPSYMKHTVLSYGSALALYVGLLREMMLAGATCGYSKAEIIDFQNDINEHLESAYNKTMFEAVSKLVKESGEFVYPSLANVLMDLGKLVGGLMSFSTEWHDGKACLIAKSHPDYAESDFVDNKAYYQLQFRPKFAGKKNYYGMPKVFMNNRVALHVYTEVDNDLQVAAFVVEKTMHIKLRVYYLIDYDDYDSSDVKVTISTSNNPKGGKRYTIRTKAGSTATKNYYIISFEIVPTNGVPDVVETLVNVVEKIASATVSGISNAVEKIASATVSGISNAVWGSIGAVSSIF